MIKKRFKDAIRQQVIESLVQEAFQEVLDREKLKVASQPHVHDLKFDEGQPLTFELHVEVRPEIALARTQGFRVGAHATPPSPTTAVREQVETDSRPEGHVEPRSRSSPSPGDMVTVRARHRRRRRRRSPRRASTRWSSAPARRSPASKS